MGGNGRGNVLLDMGGGACPLLKLQYGGVMGGHVLHGLGDYPQNFFDGALIAPPPHNAPHPFRLRSPKNAAPKFQNRHYELASFSSSQYTDHGVRLIYM
jgi:hypothetical protein